MSSGNEKLEVKTDLELGNNYSDQCILKNDSGAGANAASRADMTFVATGPLSELVWSPDKGLSLKCADSSFADKKTSLFWDVGPSNFVLAAPQSFIGTTSTTEKPIDDVFAKPVAAVCIKSNISDTDTSPPKHLTSDSVVKQECKKYKEQDTGSNGNMEEINIVERNICDQANTRTTQISGVKGEKVSTISGQVEKMPFDKLLPQADEAKPSMEHNPLPWDHTSRDEDIGVGNQAFETDDVLAAKVFPITEYKGSGAPGTKLTSSTKSHFEKPESTAENDLQTFNHEAVCGASSRVLIPKSNEIEKKSQDDEMMLQCDKNLPVLHSPSNSKIHVLRNKGKEKALSDGDINVNLSSKEEDDSHESVESCNSAGLFSTGKKRLNFQQQLMVGSKKFKKQIQETSTSKTLVKQDSSFMNWISNMMKGFSQSIQEGTNCLPHSLAYPDQSHGSPGQKLITFNRTQDSEPKTTGFHSIFQSICNPSLKHSGEDSKNFDVGNKVHGIDATPITYCAENDIPFRQYLHSDEFEGSRWRYEARPSSQPINFVNSHESSKNNSGDNKNCSNLELSKEKEGMKSNSSSSRQKTNTENIDSSALAERKEADKYCHRSDTMGSLWITRFFPKPTAPLKISDHLNPSGGIQLHSTDCSMLPHSQMLIAGSSKCKIEENREQSGDEARELPNCSIYIEASTGTMNDKVNNDHKSMYKFNPLLPSPKIRNSEPVASTFAGRLDAVKHIMPSNRRDITGKENMTCLFCGTKGHQLCDCLEIAGNELQDLLKRVNSYVDLEELPCVCIKCFQPNHWAISCPTSISRGKHEVEVHASVNDCSPNTMQFNVGNRESPKLPTGEEEARLITGCAISDEIDPQAKRNLNLKRKSNEVITSVKVESNASIKKRFCSDSEESSLKENPMRPPSCFVERKISDVPEKIFDAVKKLRLSRTDILKWMDSHMSISHLDGFYLRLRLGKWEEGLGGTGYYVASINVAPGQSSQQNSRKSVSVNVGGIKCMVESRYISNHDFLEEEIMAWWCTTSKSGGNLPSEEDLIEKIKKKRMLGF